MRLPGSPRAADMLRSSLSLSHESGTELRLDVAALATDYTAEGVGFEPSRRLIDA
jgi:hypothetical protein